MTNLMHKIFNTFITILYMYMFPAISCSSSGGQIVLIQHLVSLLSASDRPVHRLRKNHLVSSLSVSDRPVHRLRKNHLVSSLSVSDRPVHRLRKNCVFSQPVHRVTHSLTVTIPDAVLTFWHRSFTFTF